jgi:hypothetical protein
MNVVVVVVVGGRGGGGVASAGRVPGRAEVTRDTTAPASRASPAGSASPSMKVVTWHTCPPPAAPPSVGRKVHRPTGMCPSAMISSCERDGDGSTLMHLACKDEIPAGRDAHLDSLHGLCVCPAGGWMQANLHHGRASGSAADTGRADGRHVCRARYIGGRGGARGVSVVVKPTGAQPTSTARRRIVSGASNSPPPTAPLTLDRGDAERPPAWLPARGKLPVRPAAYSGARGRD